MPRAKTRQVVIEHNPDQTHNSETSKQEARSGADRDGSENREVGSPAVGAEGFDWDRVITF
jgi:hypothetical protein